MTESRFSHVVVDCSAPDRLAAFWADLLGVEVHHRWQQYVMLRPTVEGGPALAFQAVPEPKTGKNRVHVDLTVGDLAAETERAEALGATHVTDNHDEGMLARVMADPEGNEFCLVKVPDAS